MAIDPRAHMNARATNGYEAGEGRRACRYRAAFWLDQPRTSLSPSKAHDDAQLNIFSWETSNG
jgi:hypothetical protein